MNHKAWTGILAMSSAIAISSACRQQSVADTRAADERAIREVDDATKKAAHAKDAKAVVNTFYADDGSALYPNAPISTGKQALHAKWAALVAMPLSIDWQLTSVEVSRSGDLAYTPLTYQLTTQGPDGKPVEDRGKGLAVWKKQADGTWKGEADIFNSDLPLPGTTAQQKAHPRTSARNKAHPRRNRRLFSPGPGGLSFELSDTKLRR